MSEKLNQRIQRYCQLSSALSRIKNKDLAALLKRSKLHRGWGSNHQFKIRGAQVFAKKVPLTRLEHEHAFDTRNLYRLPTFYNYGVGSAGFGAFRELVTHIKTTNWVLSGEMANFPLMYHYRIMPRAEEPAPLDSEKHSRYVKNWNNSRAIDRYIRERSKAEYELVLFLEHFPHTLASWLPSNTDKIDAVSKRMRGILDFLNSKGILHFDVHLHNILSDGKEPYLSDFGLALDHDFDLSKQERAFFKKHMEYDHAECIGSLGLLLEFELPKLSKAKKRILEERLPLTEGMGWAERQRVFLKNLDLLRGLKVFNVHKKYFDYLDGNRDAILFANEFFFAMRANPKKDTKFDSARLKRYLKQSAF